MSDFRRRQSTQTTEDDLSPKTWIAIWSTLTIAGLGSLVGIWCAVHSDADLNTAPLQTAATTETPSTTSPNDASQPPTIERTVVGALVVGEPVPAPLHSGIVEKLDDELRQRLPTSRLESGTSVRVIAVEKSSSADAPVYERILAVEIRPPEEKEPAARLYGFDGSGAAGLFDATGRQPVDSGWRAPLEGRLRRTSPFNPKRLHPVLHRVIPHQGTDYGAPLGTPVYAASEGTLTWAGLRGATGNLVTIAHPDGVETGYAHLSRFAPNLHVGDHLGTHQLVGYVGSTGRSTGPHLHFSAKKSGAFFDAETLLKTAERELPDTERPQFLKVRADLDAQLDAIPPAQTMPVARGPAETSAPTGHDGAPTPRASASARRPRR